MRVAVKYGVSGSSVITTSLLVACLVLGIIPVQRLYIVSFRAWGHKEARSIVVLAVSESLFSEGSEFRPHRWAKKARVEQAC